MQCFSCLPLWACASASGCEVSESAGLRLEGLGFRVSELRIDGVLSLPPASCA